MSDWRSLLPPVDHSRIRFPLSSSYPLEVKMVVAGVLQVVL